MLQNLRLETNVEVPLGARRLRDEPVRDYNDILPEDSYITSQHDPDVWPPPTPADHSYMQRCCISHSKQLDNSPLYKTKKHFEKL